MVVSKTELNEIMWQITGLLNPENPLYPSKSNLSGLCPLGKFIWVVEKSIV